MRVTYGHSAYFTPPLPPDGLSSLVLETLGQFPSLRGEEEKGWALFHDAGSRSVQLQAQEHKVQTIEEEMMCKEVRS